MAQVTDNLCQSIAALNDNIETVMLLQDDGIVAHYSKLQEKPLLLVHATAAIKSAILRMQIFISIMKEDNIIQKAHGDLRYTKVSRDDADLFFFSLGPMKALVVSVKGHYDESFLVDSILNSL